MFADPEVNVSFETPPFWSSAWKAEMEVVLFKVT
jgi:hypothetical protein